MSSLPKVSIVVPTRNRGDLLRDALESVLEQSYGDFELIVGDDGEQGEEVIEALDDARITYLKNSPPLGMAGNFTMLLDRARGEVAGILCDDDRYEQCFLETCMHIFDDSPDVGFVFTAYSLESVEGRSSIVRSHVPAGRLGNWELAVLKELSLAPSWALLRTDAWRLVRPLPETAAADLVLFARLAAANVGAWYVDEPLARYRAYADGLSRQRSIRREMPLAWSSFSFTSPEAEARRRVVHADALLSRASLAIQEGDLVGARADVAEARKLAPSSRLRPALLRILTRHRRLAGLASSVAARTLRRPWA